MTQTGQDIFEAVAARLIPLPNKVSIEGHTDAKRLSGGKFTNWELSTARASAARIALVQDGLKEDRIVAVTGYADTKPLAGTDPKDSINRRISVMIWDEDPEPVPAAPSGPAGASGTPGASPSGPAAHPLPRPPLLPGQTRGALTPPPLPRVPTRPPGQSRPRVPTREELESNLIENTMQRAAAPDLATVGPPLPPPPPAE
jgi:chemotaxis protein MotB